MDIKPLNILFLSWRDPYNPKKGGAEIAVLEILSRLATKGHSITWFSAHYEAAAQTEIVDGIRYVRKGAFYSVHREAIKFYRHNKNQFDIVVDDFHGYPFFTNLYVDGPKFTFIHEVAGEIWFDMWPFPIAITGYIFERLFFKFLRGQKFFTVSQSTESDLLKEGIPAKNITRLKLGLNVKPLLSLDVKKNENQICFIGRICAMKGITDLLTAFAIAYRSNPDLRLILGGRVDEEYRNELEAVLAKENIAHAVDIRGQVSDEERNGIFSTSMFLVSCSVKEGFGLIILEAAAYGTPAITYNVHGYRDIITSGKNGLLVNRNKKNERHENTEQVAALITQNTGKGLSATGKYKDMQREAWVNAKQHDWNSCAKEFLVTIEKELALSAAHKKKNGLLQAISTNLAIIIFTIATVIGDAKNLPSLLSSKE